MPILDVYNLSKSFDGVKAVDGFSFALEKGQIVALVGPNGAGKTTAFNIITGYLESDQGKVSINIHRAKRIITGCAPYKIARLGIARTFQYMRLFSQMTVLENLLLASAKRKHEELSSVFFSPKSIKQIEKENLGRAEHYLDFVGLTEKRDSLAENLSHGQRKLLSLARALCLEPNILLLDEPTAGVFLETKEKIAGFFETLGSQGKTILFIEHDMHFIMNIADRVIVMSEGKKLCEGTSIEVAENPAVIEAYLGKKLDQSYEKYSN